ncbi:unnamed protein product [Prorocentrum cordatum]|uniref:Uncharacterized protein n=1 Tax=Prorocentrum cordatum TaxID=2364126 RepID=A0ABN9VI79_9DINO|nr:unnamed protein product [Polarella glacialis]
MPRIHFGLGEDEGTLLATLARGLEAEVEVDAGSSVDFAKNRATPAARKRGEALLRVRGRGRGVPFLMTAPSFWAPPCPWAPSDARCRPVDQLWQHLPFCHAAAALMALRVFDAATSEDDCPAPPRRWTARDWCWGTSPLARRRRRPRRRRAGRWWRPAVAAGSWASAQAPAPAALPELPSSPASGRTASAAGRGQRRRQGCTRRPPRRPWGIWRGRQREQGRSAQRAR